MYHRHMCQETGIPLLPLPAGSPAGRLPCRSLDRNSNRIRAEDDRVACTHWSQRCAKSLPAAPRKWMDRRTPTPSREQTAPLRRLCSQECQSKYVVMACNDDLMCTTELRSAWKIARRSGFCTCTVCCLDSPSRLQLATLEAAAPEYINTCHSMCAGLEREQFVHLADGGLVFQGVQNFVVRDRVLRPR